MKKVIACLQSFWVKTLLTPYIIIPTIIILVFIFTKEDGFTSAHAYLFMLAMVIACFGKAIEDLLGRVKRFRSVEFDQYDSTSQRPHLGGHASEPPVLESESDQEGRESTYKTIEENKERFSTLNKEKLEEELAETYFSLECYAVYNRIFGTQIRLLERLKRQNLSYLQLNNYFKRVLLEFPEYEENGWELDRYLSLLEKNQLINMEGERCTITQYGRDFLQWLDDEGMNPNKLY